jgi:hypothetical protein
MSYSCPAGSAIFFTENLCHAGPTWRRDTPRIAIFHAYSHVATHWHRLKVPPEVISGLPREKQAYFREVYGRDYTTRPSTPHTIETFVRNPEAKPLPSTGAPYRSRPREI